MSITNQINDLREQASTARAQYMQFKDATLADRSLSDEGKRANLLQEMESTNTRINALAEAETQTAAARIEMLKRSLLAKLGTSASDIIAFRDAQDRADRLESQDEALTMLERSLGSDDRSLTHAVLRRSLEEGWHGATERVTRAIPEVAATLRELTTLTEFVNDMKHVFARGIAYSMVSL